MDLIKKLIIELAMQDINATHSLFDLHYKDIIKLKNN